VEDVESLAARNFTLARRTAAVIKAWLLQQHAGIVEEKEAARGIAMIHSKTTTTKKKKKKKVDHADHATLAAQYRSMRRELMGQVLNAHGLVVPDPYFRTGKDNSVETANKGWSMVSEYVYISIFLSYLLLLYFPPLLCYCATVPLYSTLLLRIQKQMHWLPSVSLLVPGPDSRRPTRADTLRVAFGLPVRVVI
jgi:hypothetical protein